MGFIKWILALTLLVSCSKNKDSNQVTWVTQQELKNRNQVLVQDEVGNPVPEADVTIGNNTLTTDANGLLNVPQSWNKELPVTILKDGYIKTSYLQQKPQGQIFEVRHKKATIRHEVKGSVSGFGNLPNDGFIDFSLSSTSLSAQGALNFDISKLISEEYDTISVMGQKLDIPTNVFVPKQKESYGIIPVTIEKAFYRLFYDAQGTYKVQTNRGKFDFKKVADKLKSGKSFFEVVNDFEFMSLGTKTVNVNQQNVTLDLDGSQKKLTPKINFTTPVPQTGMLFGISMLEEDGKFSPSDIKLREAKTQMLALPDSATKGSVLLVYADKEQVKKDEAKLSDSMSTALVDSQKLDQGFLLDRVAAPTITATGMALSKPNEKGNLKGFATYAALSDITKDSSEISWEIYSPGWIEEIDLPEVTDIHANQSWKVVFYGIDSLENKQFNGPKTLNQATHAVHNAVQF